MADDTLVLTGPNFQQLKTDALLITPKGGSQTTLDSVINGGTVAQTITAGSTIGAGSTITTPTISGPTITGVAIESITNAITASTTQTLAGALALTTKWNVVSTVGTALDAVKLPAAGVANVGQVIWAINNGASSLAVWANETASAIDTHATNAPGTLTTLHRAAFLQNTASTWVSVASVSAAS